MKQIVKTARQQIEELIRQDKFQEALDLLRERSNDNHEEAERAWYYALTAEVMLHLGQDPEKYPEMACEFFRHSADHDGYALAKFLIGWQLQRKGALHDAKEAILESYITSLRARNVAKLARSANRLFIICSHLGQLEAAVEYQHKSIGFYREIGDVTTVAVLRYNLALTHLRKGEIRKCIELCDQAANSGYELTTLNRINLAFRYAIGYAHLNEFAKSAKHFQFIKKHVSEYKREEAIYYEYLGWAKILEKDYKAAETALKTGLELSLKMGESTTLISQTKRLLADVYAVTNRYKLAEQTALEALSVAEKIGERLEIAASWRVLAQTAAHAAHKEEALTYFRKSIDLFSQIGYKFELAYTRFLAARSGLLPAAESTVLLHMAGEYFASENLTTYMEQVEKANTALTPAPHDVMHTKRTSSVVIVGESKKMKRVLEFARKAAPTSYTILLTGQTGTGKDLLARYMHDLSGRTGSFVQFNAAAVQPAIAESVLFGTVKGVFTDATDRAGLFEAAENGTFFLNEIGNASLELQAKLLDVLETHTISRVGESLARPANFRLIAATNANLEEMIKAGTFRADLYHRLRQIPMHIPSLDERTEDIPVLVAYFLNEITPQLGEAHFQALCELLMQRSWPGNARELRSELDKLWITSNGKPEKLLHEAERLVKIQQMKSAVEEADGNCTKAARILGIDESTLRYWLTQEQTAAK